MSDTRGIEVGILGAVLRNGHEALNTILATREVSVEYFSDPEIREIYGICLAMKQAGVAIDPLLVNQELQGNDKQLDLLLALAESALFISHLPHYVEKLHEEYQRSRLAESVDIATKQVTEGEKLADVIDSLCSEMFQLRHNLEQKQGPKHVSKIFDEFINAYEDGATMFKPISLGFNLTIFRGELLVVGARPSMGKSSFAINLALNVCQQELPVLIFSFEMSKEQVLSRVLSMMSGIPINKTKHLNLDDDEFGKVISLAEELEKCNLFIDDNARVTVQGIAAKAHNMKSLHPNLGLIVIDYLQLIGSSKRGRERENRVQDLTEITRELKILARELDVSILALSQLSRAVENRADKRPLMSDLRESGSIEQDADLIMLMYRHEFYHPDEIESRGHAEINLVKNRQGPTGMIPFQFIGPTNVFKLREVSQDFVPVPKAGKGGKYFG